MDFRCNYNSKREKPSKADTDVNTASVSHKDELLTSSFNQINTSVSYALLRDFNS